MNAGPLLALITQSVTDSWPVASQEAYRHALAKRPDGAPEAGVVRTGREHPILRSLDEHFLPTLDPRHPLALADLVDRPVHVLPTPVFGAEALSIGGQGHIVVHQGTFTLLSFAVDMLVARRLTPAGWQPAADALRDHRRVVDDLFTGLCHAYLLAPFSLPVLRPWFPEERRGEMVEALCFAELFILLHEQAHIRLGHVAGDGSVREMAFGSPDAQWQELQADHEALASGPPFLRDGLLWGAAVFFFVHGMFEAVIGRRSQAHPGAEERLACLLRDFGAGAEPGIRGFASTVVDGLRTERREADPHLGELSPERRARAFLNGISPRRAVWLLQRAMRAIHGH